eukprot:PhM_4_TR7585/c0_g1_i1/m.68659
MSHHVLSRAEAEYHKGEYEVCDTSLSNYLTQVRANSPYVAVPTEAELRRCYLLRCDARHHSGKHDEALEDANFLYRVRPTDLGVLWRRLRSMYMINVDAECEIAAREMRQVVRATRTGKSEVDFHIMAEQELRDYLVARGVDVHQACCDTESRVRAALAVQHVDGAEVDHSLREDLQKCENVLEDVELGLLTMQTKPVVVKKSLAAAVWLWQRMQNTHFRVSVVSVRNCSQDLSMTYNARASSMGEGRWKTGFEPPDVIMPGEAVTLCAQNKNFLPTGVSGTLIYDTEKFSVAFYFCVPLRGPAKTAVAAGTRLHLLRQENQSARTGYCTTHHQTPTGPYRVSSSGTSPNIFTLCSHVVARFSDEVMSQIFNLLPAKAARKCTAVARPWRKLLLTAHPDRFHSYQEFLPSFPDYCCDDDLVASNWTASRDRTLTIELEKAMYVGYADFVATDVARRERLFMVRRTRSSPSQDFAFAYRNWSFPLCRAMERSMTFNSVYDVLWNPTGRIIATITRKSTVEETQILFNGSVMYLLGDKNKIYHGPGSPVLVQQPSNNNNLTKKVDRRSSSPLSAPNFSGTAPSSTSSAASSSSTSLLAATISVPRSGPVTLQITKGTDMLHVLIIAMLQTSYFRDG